MLHSMLDVTIAYSEPGPTLWDLCCGRLGPVRMHRAAAARSSRGRPRATTRRFESSAAGSRHGWAYSGPRRTAARRDAGRARRAPRETPRERRRNELGPAAPFIHERVAVHTEIDGYGHVNNAIYVAWLDDCAWAHSISRGISPELCRSLNRGMAVWRTQINYIGAALEGDEIDVATWPVLQRPQAAHRAPIPDPAQGRRRDVAAGADPLRLHRPADRQGQAHAGGIHAIRRRCPRWPPPIAAETDPYQPGVEPR